MAVCRVREHRRYRNWIIRVTSTTVCDNATDHLSTNVRAPLKIKKKFWKENEGSADVHTKTSSLKVPNSVKIAFCGTVQH